MKVLVAIDACLYDIETNEKLQPRKDELSVVLRRVTFFVKASSFNADAWIITKVQDYSENCGSTRIVTLTDGRSKAKRELDNPKATAYSYEELYPVVLSALEDD